MSHWVGVPICGTCIGSVHPERVNLSFKNPNDAGDPSILLSQSEPQKLSGPTCQRIIIIYGESFIL